LRFLLCEKPIDSAVAGPSGLSGGVFAGRFNRSSHAATDNSFL
jgi:hypothetical protein